MVYCGCALAKIKEIEIPVQIYRENWNWDGFFSAKFKTECEI